MLPALIQAAAQLEFKVLPASVFSKDFLDSRCILAKKNSRLSAHPDAPVVLLPLVEEKSALDGFLEESRGAEDEFPVNGLSVLAFDPAPLTHVSWLGNLGFA